VTVVATVDADARAAYDALAPAYDVLTSAYAYEHWLAALEELLVSHGLAGRRMLDLACGTGNSFLPFHDRGYHVTGCDFSSAMLDIARTKAPDVHLELADMRALPVLGRFDLISCLDDALNYLLDESEVAAALDGIARNLNDTGLAVWDLNTVAQYRGQFARDQIIDRGGTYIGWQASRHDQQAVPGALVDVAVDLFIHQAHGRWSRTTSVHRQRHWPRSTIEAICDTVDLELLDVRGQHPGGLVDSHLDELSHVKAIYVARAR
jgi:SAM-dependent methyltransferase